MSWLLTNFAAVCFVLIIASLAVLVIIVVVDAAQSRRRPPFSPKLCPWCDTGAGDCDCIGPCGRKYCDPPEIGDDVIEMFGGDGHA